MMRKRYSICLFLLLISIGTPSPAQTVDTAISGTVTDSTGAVIPGATVTVTSASTGTAKRAVTSSSGDYVVNYLIPGAYDVTVAAGGFATFAEKGIVLEINQQAKVNATMSVATGTQEIQVQAANQPLLQTQTSSIGTVVGAVATVNLPLNGRKFADLAILTPGVTITDADNHTSTTTGSTINAYGAQVTWDQTNVNGITMVNNRHAEVNVFPSVDAVQEFNVLTGNYSAQYGGGAGTITNIQLKSGTNALHGDVFEFLRNTAMDARNYFRPAPLPKQVLKQNQFGGTLGGPIIRDRAFFFFSYEGIRSVEDIPATANVFSAAERTGDFSALLPKTQLKSPYTGLPYKNNQIPVDTVAQNIVNTYMPLPNNPSGSYSGAATGNQSNNQFLGRIDYKFNDRNQLALHYIYQHRNFPNVSVNPNFAYTGTSPLSNAGLQYVHTFSPKLVNELRLGVDFEHMKELSTLANTGFNIASLGINDFGLNGAPLPSSEAGFPITSISGFISIGGGGASYDESVTYQMVDNLSWTRGNHQMIFGADIRHSQDNATTNNTPYGQLSFTGSETGNAGADFMLGIPASIITPEGVPLSASRQWRDFLYVQDNWRVTPNLTLNLGLQYALWVPPHDDLNTSRTLNFSTPTPTIENLPDPLWHVSHKDFSPRVGFAYSLPHQAVVRGGYGISFYGGQFDNINLLQLNPPDDPSFTLTNGTNPANPPLATINNPVPAAIKPATANVATNPADGDHPDLYLQTFNLTLSKQFWSNVLDVSYVGVKGTHQDTSIPYFNSGPPQPANLSAIGNRPYPTFGNIRFVDHHGASMYNGLNVRFEHKLTHGLDLTTSYAWAHQMDNQGGDTNGVRNETQIPTAKEWANGLTDVRHILAVAAVWQLPKLSTSNFAARAILNGWDLNAIYTVTSGSPIWIDQSADGENNGNLFERPDLVPGQPMTVANRTISKWFNTAAFTEAIGHYGSTPRNPGPTAPTISPLALAIVRSIPIPFREQRVELRLETFNVLNHPQFSAPGGAQGSSTFGVIQSTIIDNRELQVACKYYF